MRRIKHPVRCTVLRSAMLSLVAASLVWGQANSERDTRRRIGLALAGGGAKGLAHIGVLRWLEENRVPIDAIAGTSMGGLVAGMYAAGQNSGQIETFVRAIDWDVALGPNSRYRDLNIRRKEDEQSFPGMFELGMRKGRLQLPAGLNSGYNVQLLLNQIGLAYSEMRSFDDLPTPFRCVATDLLSGNKIVFKDKSLSQALRATMSLPPLFEPIAYDGMLLVDGGIVDNLPADVVRELNVDVVVAVDLGLETIGKGQGFSILGVANRSIDIMIRRNTLESLRSANVVVSPSVMDLDSLDFRNVNEIIQRGYESARSKSEALRKYAVTEDEWRSYLEARRLKTLDPAFSPEFVEVTGSLKRDHEDIMKRLEGFTRRPFDREKFEEELTHITGLGPYDTATYGRSVVSGKDGLAVGLNRKSYGPPFMRPLLILDSGQSGTASFTLAARIAAFQFPTARSEWRTDLSFGRVNSVGSEYYQYLGASRFFLAPRGFTSQEQQLIIDDGDRLADYKVRRSGGGFDAGYNFGRFSELRTGIEVAQLRGTVQIGFPILPNARGVEKIWMSRWRFNALNSGTVPTNGIAVDSQINWQFGSPRIFVADQDITTEGSFGQAWSQVVYARPFTRKWSGLLRALGGGTFSGEAQPFSEFRLGGPLRIGSLDTGELRGANVAFGSAGILREFYHSPTSFVGKLYGMLLYEVGDAFDSRPNFYHSGTAGVTAETSLGVLSTGFSYGERGRGGFFFSIGRIFDVGIRNGNQLR